MQLYLSTIPIKIIKFLIPTYNRKEPDELK